MTTPPRPSRAIKAAEALTAMKVTVTYGEPPTPQQNACRYCSHFGFTGSNWSCSNGLMYANPAADYETACAIRARIGIDKPCPGYKPTLRRRLAAWWKGERA